MNRIINIKILFYDWFNYLILFLFTLSEMFPQFSYVFKILKVLVCIIMSIYVVLSNKKNDKKLIFLLCSLLIYLLLISLIYHNLSFNNLFSIYSICILIAYFDLELKYNDRIMKNLYFYFLSILLISFIEILIRYGSITTNTMFFVGGKNALSIYFIPAMAIYIIQSYKKFNRINFRTWILLSMSCIIVIVGRSGAGILSTVVVIILLILINEFKITIKSKYFIVIYLLLQIFIINYSAITHIGIIERIITSFLHKDLTFTGRINIWSYAIQYIKNNIFGYGIGNAIIKNKFIYLELCHNSILELLLQGGIPILLIYYFIVSYCINSKNKNNICLSSLNCILFSISLITLVESIQYKIQLWIIILLIKYIKETDLFNENKGDVNEN